MMDTPLIEDRQRLLNSGIAYLRHMGYQDIKSVSDEFKDPRSIFTEADKSGYVPDVIASKSLSTFIFEIVDEATFENMDDVMEKWKIFDDYATKKGGKLYFITYHEIADELAKKCEELGMSVGFIKITK